MKQTVQFFPNSNYHKLPQGGAKVNEQLFFRIVFSRPQNPEDVYLCLTKDGENEVRYPLSFESTSIEGEYTYSVKLKVTSRGLYFYHFLICTPSEDFYVGSDDMLYAMLGKGHEWQLTVFEKVYEEPEWLKGGVMYQIMPDRFNIGGERIKSKKGVVYRDDWGAVPEYRPNKHGRILNNDFFGGNIKGITKKLGYIKSLGVNCIYLNPIFEAHSNHKYDTGNYRKIDSDFGTLADFEELIKKADKKGIKIVLDGVFSHTGDDSIYFNKYGNYDSVGAYQSQNSPYAGFYSFKNFDKREYDCWWNVDILPNTVEENVHFDEFINGEDGIIAYWTQKGIGGWRLDVVDELPDAFLDRAVRRAKRINPQALVLGEVWEDASNKVAYSKRRRYLLGGQLDSATNYPFKEDILHYVRTGNTKSLYRTLNVLKNNYPKHVLDVQVNLLSTHDTVRLLSALGDSGDVSSKDKRATASVNNLPKATTLVKLATLLQFTLPGIPCVYYGDEMGLEGFEDPFNRRCIDFVNYNKEINRWHKKLGRLRSQNKDIFAQGECQPIELGEGVFAFCRTSQSGEIFVVVNNKSTNLALGSQFEGYTDLLTNKLFRGSVLPNSGVVLKKLEVIS